LIPEIKNEISKLNYLSCLQAIGNTPIAFSDAFSILPIKQERGNIAIPPSKSIINQQFKFPDLLIGQD